MSLFVELSIIISVATLLAIVMRFLRQPLIVGHIITGIIVGPLLFDSTSIETFSLFAEIGIAILLFTVGLGLSPKVIKQFGKVALITGIGQVVVTSIVGFAVAQILGFDQVSSIYIAVALTLSSTIIIIKLLSDKRDLETLYAKISIGFLLVQDIIAVLILFIIPLVSTGAVSLQSTGVVILSGIGILTATLLFAIFVIPRLNNFLSHNLELLFLFAITWGIGIATIFNTFGFSLESGALVAGIALSTLPSRHEIMSRLSPLRDFFIIIFFIVLGSQMKLDSILTILPTAIILSLLVLIIKPIIMLVIMGLMGYKKRTSLKTGLTIAQISEFSLVLIALAVTSGHVSPEVQSLITLVGLITIFGSTYLFLHTDKIYRFLEPYLSIFERKNSVEVDVAVTNYPHILFGCNRIGSDFIQTFEKLGKKYIVIDDDPEIVDGLKKRKLDVEFGDASNLDFLDSLPLSSAEIVISTIPDIAVNSLINRAVKTTNNNAIIVVVAHKISDALTLYENGIDYVILPHFLGGQYASELILKFKDTPDEYSRVKEEHIKSLKVRLTAGHEHPEIDPD